MKKFQITDKYSIEQLDSRNWVIRCRRVPDVKKDKNSSPLRTMTQPEAIHGYYQTLEMAYEAMIDLIGRTSADYKELEKWINKLKEARKL